jgi:hypothetical protein
MLTREESKEYYLSYDEYLGEHGRDIKDSDSWKELMS